MRLPYTDDLEGVDVAIVGIPTDEAVSFRSGARFGPEAVRRASVLLRPYNPNLKVDVAEVLSMVDRGDVQTIPGYHLQTLDAIAEQLAPVHNARVIPLCLGGDHSMVVGELRAAAKVHGPLALVQLDAHADVWESYFGARYFHGTVFKRAAEEGLIDPGHSIQAGMRGTLYAAADEKESARLGYEMLDWNDLRELSPSKFGELVRQRAGGMPTFLSFDIDFFDPGFAPGTGTPEVGGPTSAEGLGYLRALTGIDFKAFDLVEVAPTYDAGEITALLGAAACFEMVSLAALRKLGSQS